MSNEMRTLPKGGEWKKLSEIITNLENGNRPKGGVSQISVGIPSIGGEHLNSKGGFNFDNTKYIPKEFYDSMNRGKIKKEDILIVKDGATTGKVSFVRANFPYGESAVNEHVFILRADISKIVPKYLFYILFSEIGQSQIMKTFHGSAIGGINSRFVDAVNIPLFSLPIQQKIVSILEQAESLKQKREQANEEADKIIQSIFYEMFGDPIKNEKKWPSKELQEISKEIQPGFAFGKFDKAEGIPHLRPFNITKSGNISFNQIKYVPDEAIKKEKYVLSFGDIILNTTNSAELVGKATIFNIRQRCAFSNHMTKIRLIDSEASQYYISTLLNIFYSHGMFKPMLKRWVNQVGIETAKLKRLSLPIPPISLQNQFASIVEKIESIKQKQNQATEEINTLFDALMQKAFNGELV